MIKLLASIIVFLVLATLAKAEDHSHNHAPGHCPACDFDISKATEPTAYHGKVENWYAEDTDQPVNSSVLILVLIGATTAILALTMRHFKNQRLVQS